MKKEIKFVKTKAVVDLSLLKEIRQLITAARSAVVQSIDYIQVHTCFEIGRRIVEHEQKGSSRAEYGKALIQELAAKLTREFGNGFSYTNLKLMRQFYSTYKERISQTSSGQSIMRPIGQTLKQSNVIRKDN